MATTFAGAAAASAASAIPQAAKTAAQQAAQQVPNWVRKLPTRQIANVLLQREQHMMDYDQLYGEVEPSGLFRSKRHFKHCLRMLKVQQRVSLICKGPETVGSAKRLFAVKLTRRGSILYSRYRDMDGTGEGEDGDGKESRGLADALV